MTRLSTVWDTALGPIRVVLWVERFRSTQIDNLNSEGEIKLADLLCERQIDFLLSLCLPESQVWDGRCTVKQSKILILFSHFHL